MRIFIDTEFTDFVDCDLISIGLVADGNRQFYGERNDFRLAGCSDFVRQVVLPQLGKKPDCVYDKADLGKAVRAWLNQFELEEPVLCFDFAGDYALVSDLLNDDMPCWLGSENIYHEIDALLFEYYAFTLFAGAQHHALHDAICNKLAFRPKEED